MRSFRTILTAIAALALLLAAGCASAPPKPQTFALGERVELGKIIYTVFETQWMTHIGSGPETRLPKDRFFVVRISAVNGGGADAMIPNMTLIDDSGAAYAETNGEGVPNWLGLLRQTKPAEAAQGAVVFDAPQRHFKLRLSDENEQKTAFVDLPLTYGTETPDLPSPTLETAPEKGPSPIRK
jgi:hypothetical protein